MSSKTIVAAARTTRSRSSCGSVFLLSYHELCGRESGTRLSRESEVRYNGSRERPMEDRQLRLQNGCQEGHTEIAFAATGTNLQLVFTPPTSGYMPDKECDFEKDPGKVHINSSFMMNGVGCLEFNEERAALQLAIQPNQFSTATHS
ncbi:hypothetical protein WA026_012330 [Henosepilachna vigintioctopunctata]|uniref:Uncharacterized protein n=1 Tax=Henosepilachna vigintioctopunctata TaxID=420089 RepID=A0AAW1V049_9CUCU